MSWVNKIDKIVLLNLPHRTDRLLESAEILEKYGIPYERIEAIYNPVHGATGLRDTMIKLFTEELDKGAESILVFEDDIKMCVQPDFFNEVMNNVINQLPEKYAMIFLGCQLTGRPSHFFSPNILAGTKMFATHAVLYSKFGMQQVLACNLQGPIDNDYVEKIENLGFSYCTYPLLCSQRAGVSDIGAGQFIDWSPFIEARFSQKIAEMNGR